MTPKGSAKLAKAEIDDSFFLSLFSMRQFGLSFDPAANKVIFYRQKIMLYLSMFAIFYHIFSDLIYICVTISRSPRVEIVVPLFHTFGYGLLSSFKLFAIWYKHEVFGQLLRELALIWPTPPLNEEAQSIKEKSLVELRTAHRGFFMLNMSGVWFYILTPIAVYFYELWQGHANPQVGFVWNCWYPFDKFHPINHLFVYIFEALSGITCVWAMVASDFLFTGMSSHICMMLRLLNQRLTTLATVTQDQKQNYKDIVECLKLHQRLISYCNELESAFSIVNLANILLSSINICCVVFVIVLLEPMVAISNKLFLGSAMIQIGVICWYSDDIIYANADVAVAAYNSGWYNTNAKCRRALHFLMARSQKPIAFTAMNFTTMSLTTYSLILYRSYSYFALLYTMYANN